MNKFTKGLATATLLTIFATGMAFSTDEQTLGPATAVDMNLMGTVAGLETLTLVPGTALNSVDLRTTNADTIIGTIELNNTDRDGFLLTFSTDSDTTFSESLMVLQNEAGDVGSIATNADAAARTASEGYFIPWTISIQFDESPTGGGSPGFTSADLSGSTSLYGSGVDPQAATVLVANPENATIGAIYNIKAHTTAVSNLFDGTYNATLNVTMADTI
ncbi:hypothetical protein HOG98_07850 [bacterium]|jgi:hypothetical protein|nr:hypothetical protein [bacterium]